MRREKKKCGVVCSWKLATARVGPVRVITLRFCLATQILAFLARASNRASMERETDNVPRLCLGLGCVRPFLQYPAGFASA